MLLPLLGISGCIGVESDQPLSDPVDANPDDRLVGTWVTGMKGDHSRWQIQSLGDGFPKGMYSIAETNSKPDDVYYLFATLVGDQRFINLAETKSPMSEKWDQSNVDHYQLFGYRIERDRLVVQVVKQGFFRSAIDNGRIKGSVDRKGDEERLIESNEELDRDSNPKDQDPPIRLHASSAELRAFFRSNLDQLFAPQRIELRQLAK